MFYWTICITRRAELRLAGASTMSNTSVAKHEALFLWYDVKRANSWCPFKPREFTSHWQWVSRSHNCLLTFWPLNRPQRYPQRHNTHTQWGDVVNDIDLLASAPNVELMPEKCKEPQLLVWLFHRSSLLRDVKLLVWAAESVHPAGCPPAETNIAMLWQQSCQKQLCCFWQSPRPKEIGTSWSNLYVIPTYPWGTKQHKCLYNVWLLRWSCPWYCSNSGALQFRVCVLWCMQFEVVDIIALHKHSPNSLNIKTSSKCDRKMQPCF